MQEQDCKQVVNELLVDIFNDILKIEHKSIESFAGKSLTMSEMHIIEAVGKSKDQQMSDIARKLRITLPTLTVSVQRLDEKGFITRRRFGADRRKVAVELTDKGKQAYEKHEDFHAKMVDALFMEFNIESMPVLVESITLLKNFFREQADELDND